MPLPTHIVSAGGYVEDEKDKYSFRKKKQFNRWVY